ncbi:unnamed protein product [Aureobasidium vineae]|uniref:Carbohydrate esterase family 4 protein n=1 Tax=Aureobasidium vineae TaxID=2773715 RepID=A0A9N8PDR5_9PEZI|nr:unnamed protein product [Aureobasidium vineae]
MTMHIFTFLTLFASAKAASAACSGPLVIDNFSNWSSNSDSLNDYVLSTSYISKPRFTSGSSLLLIYVDDGTMTSARVANGKLSVMPDANSYFYETFACQAASSNGYNALNFPVKGPAGGSSTLEIQTKSACSAKAYQSYFYYVSDLTSITQTVTVPLSSFTGANSNAITSFFGEIQFTCDSATGSGPTSGSSGVTSRATSLLTVPSSAPAPTGQCTNLLIDDWTSKSRLANAMLNPSSDDGTMASIVVNSTKNRVTYILKDDSSYFYTQLGCTNAKDPFGGISMRLSAPAGTRLSVELDSGCNGESDKQTTLSSSDLGIAFSKFDGLDISKVATLLFSQLTSPVTFGPVAFYCGNIPTEYIPSNSSAPNGSTSMVPAPAATRSALVIELFGNPESNALGNWHGADEGMALTWGSNRLTIQSNNADYAFYTQLSGSCRDMTMYDRSYLHIAYTGSTAFTITLQQHNSACDEAIAPYPETWDSLEAARYATATATAIYIPMNHFNINTSRAISSAIKGFYKADPFTLTKIEIYKSVPASFEVPNKLPSSNLIFACKKPNSFAFAIDDGSPEYVQEVLSIIKEENIKVTLFTVGAPLLRLAVATGSDEPYIVNLSVNVKDWPWAETETPEKQLDAFKRDVAKGGNLVVMQYLYPSTVGYLRQFIQIAKATGKQLLRVDQCIKDPAAPPL